MPAQKITKHACLLYLCIFEKVFEKSIEIFETGSIMGKLWDYGPQLT